MTIYAYKHTHANHYYYGITVITEVLLAYSICYLLDNKWCNSQCFYFRIHWYLQNMDTRQFYGKKQTSAVRVIPSDSEDSEAEVSESEEVDPEWVPESGLKEH